MDTRRARNPDSSRGTPTGSAASNRDHLGRDPADAGGAITRFANRAAAWTFATAFAFVLGLVAMPTTWSPASGVFTRVAAALPMLAAIVSALATWRARSALRAARTAARAPAGGAITLPEDEPHRGPAVRPESPGLQRARPTRQAQPHQPHRG